MNFRLRRLVEEFSKEFYDPRNPHSRMEYEKEQRSMLCDFGFVTDNRDPENKGRVRVHLPMVAREYISTWIKVFHCYGGQEKGVWCVPGIGDKVLVMFLDGDIHHPVVIGGLYSPKRRPPVADNPDNNLKVIKTKGTYLVMDDTPGEERIEASVKDGQIRIVIDTTGIHLINGLGGIKIKCRKLTIKSKACSLKAEKGIRIKVGGNHIIKAKKVLSLKAGGDLRINGGTVDLKGSTGVTAEGKQIAMEGDPVAGMDMHDIEVPSSSGLTRVPAVPHPYIGKLNDGLSSDVNVRDKPAATEGSKSEFGTPGHFPMPPGVKFSSPPDNLGEVTGGCIDSVTINGKPAAVIGSTVTTCDDAGQQDHCTVMAIGTVVTFPIQYPGQDPEQYRRDGGLPIRVDSPAVFKNATVYRDQPKSLTNLQWGAGEIARGKEVTLSCSSNGVREGASVMFSIYPDGANPETDPPVADIRGSNKGGRAEVKWRARDLRKPEDDIAMKWFFTAWTIYCPKETSGMLEVTRVLPEFSELKWLWVDEDGEEHIISKAEPNTTLKFSANVEHLEDGKTLHCYIYRDGYTSEADYLTRQLVEVKEGKISAEWFFSLPEETVTSLEDDEELKYVFVLKSRDHGVQSEDSELLTAVFSVESKFNVNTETLSWNDEFTLFSSDNAYSQTLTMKDNISINPSIVLLRFTELPAGKKYTYKVKGQESTERIIFEDCPFSDLMKGGY